MKDKYVCPLCGSQLKAWQEYVYEKQVLINTKTGKPYKKIIKTPVESLPHNCGLECTNEGCEFITNTILEDIAKYKYLKEIEFKL